MVCSNVLYASDNFEWYQDLETPVQADLATSASIYDATFSGYNSIVLGMFGKRVIFFCATSIDDKTDDEPSSRSGSFNRQESGSNDYPPDLFVDVENFASIGTTLTDSSSIKQSRLSVPAKHRFTYDLRRELHLKHSVLGLASCSLTNNGALDLAILTLNGISVWQYDPEKIIEYVNSKLIQND